MSDLPTSATGRTAGQIARQAADLASEIIATRFLAVKPGSPMEKTAKGRGNYVTETDLAAEQAVLRLLRQEYPECGVLSEETAAEVSDWRAGWLWVVDPLDGTGNFARGIPTFAFNIALCREGEPVLGLTRHPVTGDEFFATEGGGLWVNGERATVSPVRTLAESLMGFGLGYEYGRAKLILSLLADVWPGVLTMQNIGSAALGLAYAASGRFDLYLHSNLFPWDMAAGIVIVREAGGLALDRDGAPVTIYSEGVIAGAPGPVQDLLRLSRERPWR